MYCTQQINNDVFYVGASDRRLALFENIYPIPRGISYNSYLVMDDKTILLDTCDKSVGTQFLENIDFKQVLKNSKTLTLIRFLQRKISINHLLFHFTEKLFANGT